MMLSALENPGPGSWRRSSYLRTILMIIIERSCENLLVFGLTHISTVSFRLSVITMDSDTESSAMK